MSAAATLLAALAAPDGAGLPVPRTMLVGAHPDDEAAGAGSRLERLSDAWFVCVTDGAPRDGKDAAQHGLSPPEYAATRRRELETALARCGVAASQVIGLNCPDQQAALEMVPLAPRLADLIVQHRIEVVLTHPYEGGHPDHDATAFIVHAAVALARSRGHAADVVEWTSYHRGPDGGLVSAFLPRPEVDGQSITLPLSPAERQRKLAVIACHVTQRVTLKNLPTDTERFRPAPRYDFRRPPHDWKLHYEHHPWGMTGERFRELAAQALAQLQLEGPL